jgi:predicted amidohydrolase
MQVAAVQVDSQWEDRFATHARVRRLLERVDLPPGTLLVLPEMFDVGFSMNTAKTDPGAESVSERFCRELAAERKSAVLAGIVARTLEGNLANEALAFSADGRELARYRKMQPFTGAGEHVQYPAGDGRVIFEWQGVKISPFICYDLRFPELFRPGAREGVEFVVVIASWPASMRRIGVKSSRVMESDGNDAA